MSISDLRRDFPTMRKGNGVYLDSACQSLRPDSVIDAIVEYYSEYPSCGGRSVHSMSSTVSMRIDETREKLASFFGTDDPDCYVFTRNCTDGLNTVAFGYGLKNGDSVLTSDTEHNSNHVPWLVLSENSGVKRKFACSDPDGSFNMDSFIGSLDNTVKLVSIQHASNVTGCVTPIKDIVEVAHDKNIPVLVDGAQSTPHFKVDLADLDVDFYSMSIHKMLGPSGMGVLYGKKDMLKKLRPLSFGGGAVGLTTYDHVDLAPIPDRFESGLQDYAGIFGTKAALEYLEHAGMNSIMDHDRKLMRMIFKGISGIKGIRILGPSDPDKRCGIFSFNIDGLLSHDVAMMLDNIDNIMIRSGMHCAHPFYSKIGVSGSARASTYFYNNEEDISRFVKALGKIAEQFGDH